MVGRVSHLPGLRRTPAPYSTGASGNIWLEVQFKSQLSDTRISRAQDRSESARTDRTDRTVEIRAVEEIEKFPAETRRKAFADGESFRHAEVSVEKTGPPQGSLREV